MNKKQQHIVASLFAISLCSSPVSAALLDLAKQPLYLGQTVPPNVFFELDDSGSMDWEVMTPAHYHYCTYDTDAVGATGSWDCFGSSGINDTGRISISREWWGSYDFFDYLFGANDNTYTTGCFTTRESLEDCMVTTDPSSSPTDTTRILLDADWRIVSSDLNKTAYDPDLYYDPWDLGACLNDDTQCSTLQANFSSARSDPKQGTTGYSITYNLGNDINGNSSSEFFPATYEVWTDDAGFNGTRPRRGSNLNYQSSSNGVVDLWDQHTRIIIKTNAVAITFFSYAPTASSLGETRVQQNIAIADSMDDSICYNILGSKALVREIQAGTLAYDSIDGDDCRTLKAAKDSFANWFQYHRKRSYVAKAAISSIMHNKPNYHYGLNTINDNLFIEVPEAAVTDTLEHNNDLLDTLFSFDWPALGTPLRQGLNRAGRYFDNNLSGKEDPIGSSCQQNFTILFTDGHWNGSTPSGIGNADGDPYAVTIADIAKFYYDKDLSPLVNNIIPTSIDPATYQHMVTFGVAFGVTGSLSDTDGDGWPNPPLVASSNWGNPFTSNSSKIDDMWHAAFNSKGTFVAAASPGAVVEALNAALDNISSRIGSAASVAESSNILTTDTKIYQGLFNSDNWTGQLLSYGFDTSGNVNTTPDWDAGCVLTGGTCLEPVGSNSGKAWNQRVIITQKAGGDGIPFRAPSDYNSLGNNHMTSAQLEYFFDNSPHPYTTSQNRKIRQNQRYINRLFKYLRGDQRWEVRFKGHKKGFRNRASILGDIVHSAPSYMGAPKFIYPDSLESVNYSSFKSQHANRTPMVYVGANDGMMHGFNAETGEELLAFVPYNNKLYEQLPTLSYTDTNSQGNGYQHQYFVDGQHTIADVFIDGSWRTILIGGLGSGGQSIYALDITNPNLFSEANAEDIFLWSFSDTDDANLGYTHSQIQIAKVRTGTNQSRWAAIFANGYNNSLEDGAASDDGKAALFILFIDGGTDGVWTEDVDYVRIPVGTGSVSTPNGLGTPVAISTDGDLIVDYVYAGDLQGNLWKFSLTSASTSDWKTRTNKLFTAEIAGTSQPITTKPTVMKHPTETSGIGIVFFGTGKYLENIDNQRTNQQTQSLYAVWDNGASTIRTRTDLLQQTIVAEINQSFDTTGDGVADTVKPVRLTSESSVDYTQQYGWYMDLIVSGSTDNRGERTVSTPFIRSGRVIFTTLLPSTSVCEFGGESWIMELNAASGAALSISPFDLNNDGLFNEEDEILFDMDGNQTPRRIIVSGVQSSVGITQQPTVLLTADKEKEIKVLSGSSGLDTITESVNVEALGRQNWRQLFK